MTSTCDFARRGISDGRFSDRPNYGFGAIAPWQGVQPRDLIALVDYGPKWIYAWKRVSVSRLLPTFLALSTTAADLRGESPNEYWMDLAAEFMLQSAVEQLSGAGRERRHDYDGFYDGDCVLSMCFAYGVAGPHPYYNTLYDCEEYDPDGEPSRNFDNDDFERRLVRVFCAEQEGDGVPGSSSNDDDEDDGRSDKHKKTELETGFRFLNHSRVQRVPCMEPDTSTLSGPLPAAMSLTGHLQIE